MPREKESYRCNYAMLLEKFPGKTVLGIKEVQEVTGWSRNRVLRDVPLKDQKWISIPSLACYLST